MFNLKYGTKEVFKGDQVLFHGCKNTEYTGKNHCLKVTAVFEGFWYNHFFTTVFNHISYFSRKRGEFELSCDKVFKNV